MKRKILLVILVITCVIGNWGRWNPLGIIATVCGIVALGAEVLKR